MGGETKGSGARLSGLLERGTIVSSSITVFRGLEFFFGLMKTLLLVLFSLACIQAYKIIGDDLVMEDSWHFLGKFCFSNQFPSSDKGYITVLTFSHLPGAKGLIEWNITTPSKTLALVLYLDTDEQGSFKRAYSKFKSGNWTCDELVAMRRTDERGRGGRRCCRLF